MILVMDFNFNNLISQLIERPAQVDDLNKSVNVIGKFYARVFKFVETALKDIIGDVERLIKAVEKLDSNDFELNQSPDGDYYMTSFTDKSVMYKVSWFSCTCADHAYRAVECKHIKLFREANPIKSITPSVLPRLNVFADLSTISDAELAKQAELARADCGF